jgi:hypothetical protein
LTDGRFNFLLLGCKRVRITSEVPSDKLYRIAEAEIMEDKEADESFGPSRVELLELFRQVFESRHPLDQDLGSLLKSAVPLGVLTDIIAHALGLPPAIKQRLLAESKVKRRVNLLRALLRQTVDQGEAVPIFPPNFSAN